VLKLWAEFFNDLKWVRGRSQNTILSYQRDLLLYEEFLTKKADISAIFSFMTQKKLSIRSQARVISSIRTYLKFLVSRGEPAPELQVLRPPKVVRRLPQALTHAQFLALMEACRTESPLKTARNQITLFLLFGLGCRVSELIQLDLTDYNETEAWLKITGKGGKERMVPLTEFLQKELQIYLREVRPHLVDGGVSILINERGHRPSRVDIWRWLKAWSTKAGFESVIHPHQFRHGCATQLLEQGADLRSIQLLLGHSSLQTTQVYTHLNNKHLQDTLDRHHPLGGRRDLTS
jgi:integrase/recombinase XerD